LQGRQTVAEMTPSPDIDVAVEFGPGMARYEGRLGRDETIRAVRAAAMTFFHVAEHDFPERKRFNLEHGGKRIDDLGQLLGSLLIAGRQALELRLVEEVLPAEQDGPSDQPASKPKGRAG
jgi:hypothetical protein